MAFAGYVFFDFTSYPFIFEVLCPVHCCVTLIIDNCTVRYSASPHSHGLLTSVSRSRSSVLQCSRCASVISMSAAASRVNSRPSSQMSLMLDKKSRAAAGEWEVLCKICLYDCPHSVMVKLEDCGCTFCRDVSNNLIA